MNTPTTLFEVACYIVVACGVLYLCLHLFAGLVSAMIDVTTEDEGEQWEPGCAEGEK